MESKIQIDIDIHRQELIHIQCAATDDLRDKLLNMFLGTALPHEILDGYCRISLVGTKDGIIHAEIVPIHPLDMVKHIDIIKENAEKITKNCFAKPNVGDQKSQINKCPDCGADLEVELETGNLKFLKHNT